MPQYNSKNVDLQTLERALNEAYKKGNKKRKGKKKKKVSIFF